MNRTSIRAAVLVPACLAVTACAHLRTQSYPAFDEARAIAQGEPLNIRAGTRSRIETYPHNGITVQAVPLTIGIEPGVSWVALANQLSIRDDADIGNLGMWRIHMIGSATRPRWQEAASGSRYLFPRAAQLAYERADINWIRDAAAGWGPVTLADYRADHATFDPRSSPFYLDGVEALAVGTGIVIPSAATVGPRGTHAFWAVPEGAEALVDPRAMPGSMVYLPHGFGGSAPGVRPLVPAIDSVRLQGAWVSTRDESVWSVRAPVDITSLGANATLDSLHRYLVGKTVAEVDSSLARAESAFLESLDAHRVDEASIYAVCFNVQVPSRPCLELGRDYRFTAFVASSSVSADRQVVSYPYRVQRQNRALGFVIGMGGIWAFLLASTL